MEKLIAAVSAVAIVIGVALVGHAVGGESSASSSVAAPPASTAQASNAAAQAITANSVASGAGHVHSGATAVDDRGFSLLENGVQHSHTFTQPISPADRVLLAHQLELARQVALQYPTVADAERAGLHRAGPFSPGLGAHYISYSNALSNTSGVMDDNAIRRPLAWIYDGTKPQSRIAGLFYMTGSPNPQGFAGPNDVWHVHHDICIKAEPNGVVDAPLGADHDATKAQCDAVGGNLLKQTQYLLHTWVVPGYESPEGVFSHLSSAITCADGTYNTIADVTKVGSRTTMCRDNAE
jgi:hypothetical protein